MRTYQGTRLEEDPGKARPDGPLSAEPRSAKLPANYFPEPDLVKAVNLALLLEKPLLVMGDPGCGKSMLASAIAAEWYKGAYEDYYFEWNIRSASRLNEGIAEMDHLERLRDANYEPNKALVDDVDHYMHYGPFYKAFHKSMPDEPAVLLIDEIDKADIDFPNDLLMELDKFRIVVRDTGEDFQPKKKPVIIITSNKEKDLPDAFLRRCVYHYIEPLTKDKLRDIVIDRFFRDRAEIPDTLIEAAIQKFIEVRAIINSDILSIGKNISTSEFIDWFKALSYYNEVKGETDPATRKLVAELKTKFVGDKLPEIPFASLLLKTEKSLLHFSQKPVKR